MSYILDENETENSAEPIAEEPETAERVARQAKAKEVSPNELDARVSELEDALRVEKAKSEDLFRRLQYLQADFENYRRRAEKELSDVKRFGNERLLSDLLTVKDELELAYSKADESKENPVIIDGVGMTLRRLQNLLTKEGIEKVPGVGSIFNPDYHEAALRVPSEEDEGTVVEEVRSGYMLKGRVLRASIVKVSERAPVEETETGEKLK